MTWFAVAGAGASIVGSLISSSRAASASKSAARLQARTQEAALRFAQQQAGIARRDLAPFQQVGVEALPALQEILTPEGQASFLQDNPIFDAALRSFDRRTNAQQAARGRFGAGDTAGELFENFMVSGIPLLANQQDRLFEAARLGQNSAVGSANIAAGLGGRGAGLITGQGDSLAAGIVGASNARAAGLEQAFSAIPPLLGGIGRAVQNRRENQAFADSLNQLLEQSAVQAFPELGNIVGNDPVNAAGVSILSRT